MKSFLFILAATLFFGLNVSAQSVESVIKFDVEEYNFGKIKQNVPVNYNFKFKNIGKTPVTIESAQASCGCTTPVWPQAPVMMGKTNTIKAGFNAKDIGVFEKTITIKVQGIAATKVIKIKGEVVAANATTQPKMVKPKKA